LGDGCARFLHATLCTQAGAVRPLDRPDDSADRIKKSRPIECQSSWFPDQACAVVATSYFPPLVLIGAYSLSRPLGKVIGAAALFQQARQSYIM